MELFRENSKRITVFAKTNHHDVWLGSKSSSENIEILRQSYSEADHDDCYNS